MWVFRYQLRTENSCSRCVYAACYYFGHGIPHCMESINGFEKNQYLRPCRGVFFQQISVCTSMTVWPRCTQSLEEVDNSNVTLSSGSHIHFGSLWHIYPAASLQPKWGDHTPNCPGPEGHVVGCGLWLEIYGHRMAGWSQVFAAKLHIWWNEGFFDFSIPLKKNTMPLICVIPGKTKDSQTCQNAQKIKNSPNQQVRPMISHFWADAEQFNLIFTFQCASVKCWRFSGLCIYCCISWES